MNLVVAPGAILALMVAVIPAAALRPTPPALAGTPFIDVALRLVRHKPVR